MTQSPTPTDTAVHAISEAIIARRLQAPALFLLEAHLPMASLLENTVLFFEPLAAPFFGFERLSAWRRILGDRALLEQLSARLSQSLRAEHGY